MASIVRLNIGFESWKQPLAEMQGKSVYIRLKVARSGVLAPGGKKFCTTMDTLSQREPDSMLAVMFSGRHTLCQDSEGYVFVDRDGKHFRHILNWLKGCVVPTLSDAEYSELKQEAEFYQLLELIDEIIAVMDKRTDNEKLKTELTRIDIFKCIQSNKVKFRGLYLSGLDLSKLDLSYVDFSYACLENVNFSHANLNEASFQSANLQNANLQGACLQSCKFDMADLHYANLQKVDLKYANLEGANLEEANFSGARLGQTNFMGANLQWADLRGVDLRETILDGANLHGANLNGAMR